MIAPVALLNLILSETIRALAHLPMGMWPGLPQNGFAPVA